MMSSERASGVWRVVVLSAGLITYGALALQQNVSAGAQADTNAKPRGNAEAGRNIFNGKGACYYCHGTDGYRDKLPQIESDTAALIAQLSPQPADLRNAKVLHLKTDKQRARAIREGHRGTGMFPDTTMTDQELTDTLAYLATIRRE
jgi:mono/diheme cytochrome c family protein